MDETFEPFLQQCWSSIAATLDITIKLHSCQRKIKTWAGGRFNNLRQKIDMSRRKLNNILNSHLIDDNLLMIKELERDIERMKIHEEIHWKQRARANWLNHGDRNTSFFHTFASERRRKNHIKGLMSELGEWKSDAHGMSDIVLRYFQLLFTSSNPSS